MEKNQTLPSMKEKLLGCQNRDTNLGSQERKTRMNKDQDGET